MSLWCVCRHPSLQSRPCIHNLHRLAGLDSREARLGSGVGGRGYGCGCWCEVWLDPEKLSLLLSHPSSGSLLELLDSPVCPCSPFRLPQLSCMPHSSPSLSLVATSHPLLS